LSLFSTRSWTAAAVKSFLSFPDNFWGKAREDQKKIDSFEKVFFEKVILPLYCALKRSPGSPASSSEALST